MKKVWLFILLLSSASLIARELNPPNYTYNVSQQIGFHDGIFFVEDGIQFRVHLNGTFNFQPKRIKSNRRAGQIPVGKDYLGRIRRVGSVFINYDLRGNVRRIGDIRMQYRRGRLTRVGNLKIRYNRKGGVTFYGRVRYNDFYANNYLSDDTSLMYEFDHPLFYSRNFVNTFSHVREDTDYIYYRAQQDGNDIKKGTIIKRRKKESQDSSREVRRVTTATTRNRN